MSEMQGSEMESAQKIAAMATRIAKLEQLVAELGVVYYHQDSEKIDALYEELGL